MSTWMTLGGEVVEEVVLVGFGEVGGSVGNPAVVQPELSGVGSADGLLRTMVSSFRWECWVCADRP